MYVLLQEHSANTCDVMSGPRRSYYMYYAEKTEQSANHDVLNILHAIKEKITLT
jgi:hypothetical protein